MRMNNFRVKRHMLGVGPRPDYKLTRFVSYDAMANDVYDGQSFHRIVREWERSVPWYAKRTGEATMTLIANEDNLGMTLIIEIPDRGRYDV